MNFAPQTLHSSDCGMVGTFPGWDCLVRLDLLGFEEPPTMCSGEGMEREDEEQVHSAIGQASGQTLVIITL